MNQKEFAIYELVYRPVVPTQTIKGDKRVTIEIDEPNQLSLSKDKKRIKVTCFDFQLTDTLERYKSKNPIILKEW